MLIIAMRPLTDRLASLLRAVPGRALAAAAAWLAAFESVRIDMPEGVDPEDIPPPFY
jgi:hypothetical protein